MMAMTAVAWMALSACGNKHNPAQQALELVESTTPKIEQARDMAELNSIQEDFQKQFEAIESPEDYTPTPEEESSLQKAMQDYLQAYIMKVNQLADTSTPITSDAVDRDADPGTVSEGILEASEE